MRQTEGEQLDEAGGLDYLKESSVHADTDGDLLGLERNCFLELVGRESAVGLAVAAALSRRLHRADETILPNSRRSAPLLEGVSRSQRAGAMRRRRRPREPLLTANGKQERHAKDGAQAATSGYAPSRPRTLLATNLSAIVALAGLRTA
jgi:CRP-like cAMP-binding protein